jgi:hypothetical protein
MALLLATGFEDRGRSRSALEGKAGLVIGFQRAQREKPGAPRQEASELEAEREQNGGHADREKQDAADATVVTTHD